MLVKIGNGMVGAIHLVIRTWTKCHHNHSLEGLGEYHDQKQKRSAPWKKEGLPDEECSKKEWT
jgi:hypothetical protein